MTDEEVVRWLTMDRWSTISLLELIWTTLALFAWVRYFGRAWRACRSEREIRAERAPLTLRIRAQSRCERFLFFGVMSEALCLIGLSAMTQPAAIASWRGDPVALLGPLLMLLMLVLLIMVGERTEYQEHQLTREYDRAAAAARNGAPPPTGVG